MKNKKVLICIDWFLPAYKAGGPIQSISNMVNHLKNHIEFGFLHQTMTLIKN